LLTNPYLVSTYFCTSRVKYLRLSTIILLKINAAYPNTAPPRSAEREIYVVFTPSSTKDRIYSAKKYKLMILIIKQDAIAQRL
jgi:hypothetical protein